MASNSSKTLVPEAKASLEKFKYEVASEVGVNLKNGYNGDISAKDAGRIGAYSRRYIPLPRRRR